MSAKLTDHMHNNNIDKALNIISNNLYLSLATSDKDGTPWIAPVYYVADSDLSFYFHSNHNALHSQHIKYRQDVAFSIFDSRLTSRECTGLQVRGTCSQITEGEDLSTIVPLYYKKANASDPDLWSDEWQNIDYYMGAASRRFYKIKPLEIFIPSGETDERVSLNLESLIKGWQALSDERK